MTNRNPVKTDYHVHSTFSIDGHDTMEAVCRQAVAMGLVEIAFTEHAEWHPAYPGHFDTEQYFMALERCRDRFGAEGLTIYSGVELGNPHDYPEQAGRFVDDYSFDVRVASVHWLYGENIHDAACFAGRDPQEIYADYFTSLGHMASDFTKVDVIAHFDRILWRGSLLGARFNLGLLESVVRDALATIAWRGLALELNTRLLGQKPNWHEELITMLRWYREEGGRLIVVNSDAHQTGHLGSNMARALEILDQAGLEPGRLRVEQTQPVIAF